MSDQDFTPTMNGLQTRGTRPGAPDYRVIDGRVIDYSTGRGVWSGDAAEVAGYLLQLHRLQARVDELQSIQESLQKALNCSAEDYVKARKEASHYEEWYMRASSAFDMAKWRADRAEADQDLWKRRALYARRRYHQERRRRRALQETCREAVSDLLLVGTLAIGSEYENTIINVLREITTSLQQAADTAGRGR